MDYEKIDASITLYDENSAMLSSFTEASLDIEPEEIEAPTEYSNAIQEFLDSQFGSKEDLEVKKLMALSTVAAGSEESPEEIASQVDASAVYTKAAYKVSTGELDITEATDVIIDHGAARLNTFLQSKLDMEVTGEVISNIIANVYPPAIVAKPYIKAIIKKAEPAVRKFISAGINTIATAAKKAVHTVASSIKDFAKRILNA